MTWLHAQTDTLAIKIANGEYQIALETYHQRERSTLNATELHNIGVCYEHLGNTAEAIIAYEQALALNPLSVKTRENLRLAYEREHLLDGRPMAFFDNLGYIASPSCIGGGSALLFFLALTSIIFFRILIRQRYRRVALYIACISLSACLVGNILLLHQWYYNGKIANRAIVTRETPLRALPQRNAEVSETLKLGSPVSILGEEDETSEEFIYVELTDGREGWIEKDTQKRILPI